MKAYINYRCFLRYALLSSSKSDTFGRTERAPIRGPRGTPWNFEMTSLRELTNNAV